MSIVTKAGDGGKTFLCCGPMVKKDDLRVDMCGLLDELSSFLGISKSLVIDGKTRQALDSAQKELFVIGSEVATPARFSRRLKKRLSGKDVKRLEVAIRELEEDASMKRCSFCIPGDDYISSTLDVARAVARRAERRAVSLKNRRILNNAFILIYLNRLSDLLYLMARRIEKEHKNSKL